MKFKLDENFGTRSQALIQAAGYDVHTVCEENLQGTITPLPMVNFGL